VVTQPPILPYAIQFFNIGMNDSSRKIFRFCQKSLGYCSEIIHPKIPPLLPKESLKELDRKPITDSILNSEPIDNLDDIENQRKKRKIISPEEETNGDILEVQDDDNKTMQLVKEKRD